jgi:hypothetical protein
MRGHDSIWGQHPFDIELKPLSALVRLRQAGHHTDDLDVLSLPCVGQGIGETWLGHGYRPEAPKEEGQQGKEEIGDSTVAAPSKTCQQSQRDADGRPVKRG